MYVIVRCVYVRVCAYACICAFARVQRALGVTCTDAVAIVHVYTCTLSVPHVYVCMCSCMRPLARSHILYNRDHDNMHGTVSSKIIVFSSFQIFGFSVNSKEFLSNGPYASKIGLSIIKLLGTEFIISHTFQCERYFSFAQVVL